MTVTVLLFASYADAIGQSTVTLAMMPGTTVSDAVHRVRLLRGGDRVPAAPLVAVNERYASLNHRLASGDEVALIPPVAGG